MEVYVEVGNFVVIGQDRVKNVPADKFADVMQEIAKLSVAKTAIYVDRLSTFFHRDNLKELLREGDSKAMVVAKYLDVDLTVEDMDLAQRMADLLARIDASKTKVGSYVLAEVPNGWKFNMRVEGSKVYNRATYSYHGDYGMTLTRAERFWNICREFWRTSERGDNDELAYEKFAGGDGHAPVVYHDRLEIGCQTVRRVDIEHLAKEQGWKFD